jgi:hypothetical protein
MKIFFQDLKEDTQRKIIDELTKKLKPEIRGAVEAEIDEDIAKMEIVDDYLNTHNFGIELNY